MGRVKAPHRPACAGSAASTADRVDETIPPYLEGSYTLDDCEVEASGGYSRVKEE